MSESIGEYIPIGEIHPHPDNPRVNEYAVDEVAGSIRRFGFSAPIIVRREDSVIIEGHTRWKAAKALKLDSVPVRFMDLNPVDARLLMLASNRIGELAWWDDKKLTSILQELRDEDLSGLGWDDAEIENLTGEFSPLDQKIDKGWDEVDMSTSGEEVVCPHCGETI